MKKSNNYTKEFKIGAVKMVLQEKHRAHQVAENLGIARSTLSTWIQDYKESGNEAFPGKGLLNPRDEEVRKLKLDLRRAEMERDLLKKTIAFFAAAEKKNT
jgi:transposase